jgi:hypothetical protein
MEGTRTKETLSSPVNDPPPGTGRGRFVLVAGVLAVAAAVAVTAWITAWIVRGDPEPSGQPPDGSHAEAVAVGFMEAAHAYNLDHAVSLVAEDAQLNDAVDIADWRDGLAWDEALRFTLADLSCREGKTTSAGTAVRCSYAFHALGSDELGRGPYGGGVADLVVRDGKVTSLEEEWPFLTNGFSEEMWEPFEAWVTQQDPEAAQVLYHGPSEPTADERSTELQTWRDKIAEYLAAQR